VGETPLSPARALKSLPTVSKKDQKREKKLKEALEVACAPKESPLVNEKKRGPSR